MKIVFILMDILIVLAILTGIGFIYMKIKSRKKPLKRVRPNMEVFHNAAFKMGNNGQQFIQQETERAAQAQATQVQNMQMRQPADFLAPKSEVPHSDSDLSVYPTENGSGLIRSRLKQHEEDEDFATKSVTPFNHGGMNMNNNSDLTNLFNM